MLYFCPDWYPQKTARYRCQKLLSGDKIIAQLQAHSAGIFLRLVFWLFTNSQIYAWYGKFVMVHHCLQFNTARIYFNPVPLLVRHFCQYRIKMTWLLLYRPDHLQWHPLEWQTTYIDTLLMSKLINLIVKSCCLEWQLLRMTLFLRPEGVSVTNQTWISELQHWAIKQKTFCVFLSLCTSAFKGIGACDASRLLDKRDKEWRRGKRDGNL